jgi:hypothetical protein
MCSPTTWYRAADALIESGQPRGEGWRAKSGRPETIMMLGAHDGVWHTVCRAKALWKGVCELLMLQILTTTRDSAAQYSLHRAHCKNCGAPLTHTQYSIQTLRHAAMH